MKTTKAMRDRDPTDPADIEAVSLELQDLMAAALGERGQAVLQEVRAAVRELREELEVPTGSGQTDPPGGAGRPPLAREPGAE